MCHSATMSLCMYEDPRRQVEVLCQLTFFCSKVPVLWPKRVPAAVYCSLECSCVMHLLLILGLAIILAFLALALRLSCPTPVCRRLAFAPTLGGSHCLPASVASAWTTPSLAFPGSSGTEHRRAVHLGLPKGFMRFRMWLLLSSSSLVISGFTSWNSSRTPVASMVLTTL